MIPHWQPWLKRFWIVSSPETFSADRLYLVLKHSRLHSLLKFSTHMVALVVVWVNPLFWEPLQWALTLALLTSLTHLVYSRNHHGQTLVVQQVVYREGKWSLGFGDGRWQQAQLLSPLHVGYFFVVLGFKLKGEMLKGEMLKSEILRVVVGRDACGINTYRRMTVFIRHHGPSLLDLS